MVMIVLRNLIILVKKFLLINSVLLLKCRMMFVFSTINYSIMKIKFLIPIVFLLISLNCFSQEESPAKIYFEKALNSYQRGDARQAIVNASPAGSVIALVLLLSESK